MVGLHGAHALIRTPRSRSPDQRVNQVVQPTTWHGNVAPLPGRMASRRRSHPGAVTGIRHRCRPPPTRHRASGSGRIGRQSGSAVRAGRVRPGRVAGGVVRCGVAGQVAAWGCESDGPAVPAVGPDRGAVPGAGDRPVSGGLVVVPASAHGLQVGHVGGSGRPGVDVVQVGRRTGVVPSGSRTAVSRAQMASRSQSGGMWVRRPTPTIWPVSSSTMLRRSAPRWLTSCWRVWVAIFIRPPARVCSSQPGVASWSSRASRPMVASSNGRGREAGLAFVPVPPSTLPVRFPSAVGGAVAGQGVFAQ
jgi:hypothetical protein